MTTTYLKLSSGSHTEARTVATSAGAGDADKIPSLDAAGKLGVTMMPATYPAVYVNTLRPVITVNSSTGSMTALRAYFMYMGQVTRDITVDKLRFTVTSAGSGSQTAEAALYSSAAAPSGSLQDLTRIGAGTGTVDSLTSTGHKTATLSQAVSAGTHLWAALRTNMGSGQPNVYRSMFDDGGLVAHCYGAPGALTSAGSISSGSLTNPSITTSGLNLVLTF